MPPGSAGSGGLGIARLKADGSFDTTFGGGSGWVASSAVAHGDAIAVAPDGGYFVVAVVAATTTEPLACTSKPAW